MPKFNINNAIHVTLKRGNVQLSDFVVAFNFQVPSLNLIGVNIRLLLLLLMTF